MKAPAFFLPILFLPALLFLSSGCSDSEAFTCFSDFQCPGDHFCIDGACLAACAQDEDCDGVDTCEIFQRPGEADPVQACMEHNPDGTSVECQSDASCRQTFNDPDAYCGIHGYCIHPGRGDAEGDFDGDADGEPDSDGDGELDLQYFLVIEQLGADGLPFTPEDGEEPADSEEPGDDEEPADGEESEDPDPDSDEDNGEEDNGEEDGLHEDEPDPGVHPLRIGAVVIRNSQNSAIGYGEILSLQGHPDVYGSLMVEQLTLQDEGFCPENPSEAPYASLGGPGGRALISFFERLDHPLELLEGWRIEIIADSPQCLLGDDHLDPDLSFGEYRAFFCVSTLEDFDSPELLQESCPLINDGPLAGFHDLEVTFEN